MMAAGSALAVANDLLPGQSVGFAAFGILDGDDAGNFKSTLPLAGIPLDHSFRSDQPESTGFGIMAVNGERLFLIHLGRKPVTAEMLATFDIQAEVTTLDERSGVVLRADDFLNDAMGIDFRIPFTLTDNPPWSAEGLARNLADAANQAGDPANSSVPLVRFLARSIHAHQIDEPAWVRDIIPVGYRALVRNNSIRGVIRKLSGEEGWLNSFAQAFEMETVEEDEIFLRFETDRWILTNRKLYLLNPQTALSLDEIVSYGFRGFFNRHLEIRTARTVLKPRGPESAFLSAEELSKILSALSKHKAARARGAGR